jgi:hypothetical protein
MTQTPDNALTLEGVADDLETVKSVIFTLARQYERIDRTLDRTATQQEVNTQAIAQLAETSTQQWEVIQQMLVEIREMQAEVRGLQVENRRILERVFGPESE